MSNDWSPNLKLFAKSIEVDLTKVLKKVGFDVLRGVIQKTPVDTGRARSSWELTVDKENVNPPPASGTSFNGVGEAIAKGTAELQNVGPYSTIIVSTNLDYMEYLENGSSKQAPNGMVAITLEEVKASFK